MCPDSEAEVCLGGMGTKTWRASLDGNVNMESTIKSYEEIGHSGTGMGSGKVRGDAPGPSGELKP